MKKIAATALLLSLLFAIAACAPEEKTVNGFSMGSFFYVDYVGSADIKKDVFDRLDEIERTYSATFDSSVIARINAAERGDAILLSAEETRVFSRVFSIADRTERAFDPAVYPLVCAWGFDPPFLFNNKTPPSDFSIAEAKSLSSLYHFSLNSESISPSISKDESGAKLDFGGAIKGYAANELSDLLKTEVTAALVNVGGTIAAVNRDYTIGVTPPRESKESFVFSFTLEEGEICATSGDYERYYEFEGKRYHHIIDEFTGCPAESGVIAATVVSTDGILSDCLATAAVVAGKDQALRLFSAFGVRGAIITEDLSVYTFDLTAALKDPAYTLFPIEAGDR